MKPPKSTVKVYRAAGSPYYQARFLAYNAKLQRWDYIQKSTKSTDAAEALTIGRKLEKIAHAAAPTPGTARLSRDYIVTVINEILTLAGHEPHQDRTPFADYATYFFKLKEQKATEAAKTRPDKQLPGTLVNQRAHAAAFVKYLPAGEAILDLISAKQIHDFYHHTIKSGLSPTTANHRATTLHSIFQRAVDEGLITANPVALLDRLPNACRKRDTFSADQLATLIAHLRTQPATAAGNPADWLTVTLLGLCTGQRLSDCASATWTEMTDFIDLPKVGRLRVWRCDQGKTGAIVHIPLISPLAEHIEALEATRPSDTLFIAPTLAGRSSGFRDPSGQGLSREFSAHLTRAGIAGRRIEGTGAGLGFHSLTFHSLRHTTNSLLANAGIPQDLRKKITGHADDATNDRYTHFDLASIARALAKAMPTGLNGARGKTPARKKAAAIVPPTILEFRKSS